MKKSQWQKLLIACIFTKTYPRLLDYNIILLCVEHICNVYVLRNQNVQMQIFCARHWLVLTKQRIDSLEFVHDS